MTKTVCALFTVAGLSAAPAVAGSMGADEARRFVVENLFSFTCFEGTSGEGRVHADGSVEGAIRLGGSGPTPSARNPAGSGRVHLRRDISPAKGPEMERTSWLLQASPRVRDLCLPASASHRSAARRAHSRRHRQVGRSERCDHRPGCVSYV